MSDLETRMGILEHRMDNNEEQNRRLEDELVRSRIEVRDALQRLDARTNETNQRIDQLSSQLTGQTLELSREILNMSGELRRTNRWIVTVAATMTTAITVLLPITFKLADRYL